MSSQHSEDETPSQDEVEAYESNLEEIRKSMAAVKEVIKAAHQQAEEGQLDFTEGISLLTLKCNMMVQYLQSLVLISAHRILGNSMDERSPPVEPFSDPNRGPRGTGGGDMVDAAIESRLVLERVMLMEDKMKHQIDKLIEAAQEEVETSEKSPNDPLSFKPNPGALMGQDSDSEGEEGGEVDENGKGGGDGIYRPPKLAPMPYTEPRKGKSKDRRQPLPSALKSLAQMDLSTPHVESTSGLGSTPALTSGRAKELKRMTEFEEENMMRLVMKKKEAKRRDQDEADIALGGIGGGSRGGRGGGLADEFGDILRSVGRSRRGAVGDGYEELRQKGKKANVLSRSRERSSDMVSDEGSEPRPRKKSRFEQAVKAARRKKANR